MAGHVIILVSWVGLNYPASRRWSRLWMLLCHHSVRKIWSIVSQLRCALGSKFLQGGLSASILTSDLACPDTTILLLEGSQQLHQAELGELFIRSYTVR